LFLGKLRAPHQAPEPNLEHAVVDANDADIRYRLAHIVDDALFSNLIARLRVRNQSRGAD
jgi:hypothetical protein